MTERTTILSRHGVEAILAYLKQELPIAELKHQSGYSYPAPTTEIELGFLKLAESTFKEAMRTDGLSFMFPRACSEYLCQCITRLLDADSLDAPNGAISPSDRGAISPSDREELIDLRSQLRKARLLDLPLCVAPKYDFELKTAAVGPFVRVSFTEDELRKLARGTHECVVFTAVVPPDPISSITDSHKE